MDKGLTLDSHINFVRSNSFTAADYVVAQFLFYNMPVQRSIRLSNSDFEGARLLLHVPELVHMRGAVGLQVFDSKYFSLGYCNFLKGPELAQRAFILDECSHKLSK